MKNTWLQLPHDEKLAALQAVAGARKINERAVEKDWWVTVVLKALYSTPVAPFLFFKGGTSLSKGWNLINRFSEDIDLSIGRDFFLNKLGKQFAKAETNNQLKNLRKASRDYVHEVLSPLIENELKIMGIVGSSVINVTHEETAKGLKPISHDSDPTVIHVEYNSILPSYTGDIKPRVKIEISCLSMDEPFEEITLNSMFREYHFENPDFPEIDEEIAVTSRTVTPTRTFLEKILLLGEELQKVEPRTRRMSRHLYDIERIKDTEYGKTALNDPDLYKKIILHREKFYHLGYIDYQKDYPDKIQFIPTGKVLDEYRKDYDENMVDGYIYNEALPFDILIEKLSELQDQIRKIIL